MRNNLLRVLTLGMGLALLVTAGAVSTHAQRRSLSPSRNTGWLTYLPPDRSFSLQFPNGVREQQFRLERELPYLIGTLVIHEPQTAQHFEIGYIDFLGAIGAPAEFVRERIDAFAAGSKENGGTILNRRQVVTGNCTGEEVTMRVANSITKAPSLLKARAYFSNGILYFLYYSGASDAAPEAATADHFLNSFKIAGGCRDSITVPAGANPLVWFSGTLDPETGWHRVDSPFGASFMFPSPGSLRWVDDRPPSGVVRHYNYEYRSPEYLFNVEILSGFKPATRSTAAQRKLELERYLTQTKQELSGGGYLIGECKPIVSGEYAGYDCPLKLTGNELTGHAEIFVSPTRSFYITAFRYHPRSDDAPVDRFLASIEIEPKLIFQGPTFSGN